MKKIISALLVAVTLVGASISASSEASARPRHYGGPGVAFGLLGGMLLGGAIAASQPRYYYGHRYYRECEDRFVGYDRWGNPRYRRYCW